MAKSLRSKIKRKFRTELRKRIGVPHEAVRDAKIQENLKKTIESQVGGSSVAQLKKLMGSASAPVASIDNSMEVEEARASVAQSEAQLLNEEALKEAKKDAKKKAKKVAAKRRSKKFVHFHTLRKKGV